VDLEEELIGGYGFGFEVLFRIFLGLMRYGLGFDSDGVYWMMIERWDWFRYLLF
jgi:hypothetical protein